MSAARAALLTFCSSPSFASLRRAASCVGTAKSGALVISLLPVPVFDVNRKFLWPVADYGDSTAEACGRVLLESHQVSQGLACRQATNVGGHVTHAALKRLTGHAGNVRGHEHVIEFREWILGR